MYARAALGHTARGPVLALARRPCVVLFVPYNISLRTAVFLKVNSVQCYLHMGKTRCFMYDDFCLYFIALECVLDRI